MARAKDHKESPDIQRVKSKLHKPKWCPYCRCYHEATYKHR